MKALISKIVYFAALAAVFSLLEGCGGTETSSNVGGSNSPPTSAKTPAPGAIALSSDVTESELKEIRGNTFKLSDKKGKVVLLNLWATWCGPCRGEMPTLVRLQDEYRDQGFEIIGLNTDDEPVGKIDPFITEMKLNYTIVWSDGNFQGSLLKISKFPAIPQSFLIDRDGNLRAVFTGGGPDTIRKMDENVARIMREQG